MKISIFIGSFIAVITGCGSGSDGADFDGVDFWTTESQRIVIERFNGFTLPEDRYSTYDYSRDTLSQKALDILDSITVINENLYCSNDGRTYDIIITDSEGIEHQFYSNNRSCGREGDAEGFIEEETLEELVEVLDASGEGKS